MKMPTKATVSTDPKFYDGIMAENIALAEGRERAARETDDKRYAFDKKLEAKMFRIMAYRAEITAAAIRKTGSPNIEWAIPDDVESEISATVERNTNK